MKTTKELVKKCSVQPIDPYTERWMLYEIRERVGKTPFYGCEPKDIFSLKVLQNLSISIVKKYPNTFEVKEYSGKTYISLL
jgi:hypothetical protein